MFHNGIFTRRTSKKTSTVSRWIQKFEGYLHKLIPSREKNDIERTDKGAVDSDAKDSDAEDSDAKDDDTDGTPIRNTAQSKVRHTKKNRNGKRQTGGPTTKTHRPLPRANSFQKKKKLSRPRRWTNQEDETGLLRDHNAARWVSRHRSSPSPMPFKHRSSSLERAKRVFNRSKTGMFLGTSSGYSRRVSENDQKSRHRRSSLERSSSLERATVCNRSKTGMFLGTSSGFSRRVSKNDHWS